MKHNDTIEELLIASEGEHYEFKEAKNKYEFTEVLKYCCALANCGVCTIYARNQIGS